MKWGPKSSARREFMKNAILLARKATVLLACLLLPIVASAEDIRGYVSGSGAAGLTQVIEPDKGPFGIPWGTTEDEFLARFGKPMGYMRVTDTETAMMYGRRYLFLFEDRVLSGVRVGRGLMDWSLAQRSTYMSVFDPLGWKLDIGLGLESTLAEAEAILGDKLQPRSMGIGPHYETEKARVELLLSRRPKESGGFHPYVLFGLTVRLK
jgi:hypothetical protein